MLTLIRGSVGNLKKADIDVIASSLQREAHPLVLMVSWRKHSPSGRFPVREVGSSDLRPLLQLADWIVWRSRDLQLL